MNATETSAHAVVVPLRGELNRSHEAEQAVLAALLLENSAWRHICDAIGADDFYRRDHRIIWQAIVDMIEDGRPADALTVAERLEASGFLDDAGGREYIASLSVPSIANVRRYAEIVRECAELRRIAAALEEMRDQVFAPGLDSAAVKAELAGRLHGLLAPTTHESGHLDLRDLATRAPVLPRDICGGLFIPGYISALFSHGGAGKSSIALYVLICIAAGLAVAGHAVERMRCFFLSCEDRADLLHWRIARICKHLGIDLAQLDGWLYVVDMVGRDAVLWQRDQRTGRTDTRAYRELAAQIRAVQADILCIDGISDTFGGNENIRGEVKQYLNSTIALVPPAGAVLLLGHVAKATASHAATSEGYSGSTGWHNGVRARWYLYPETSQSEDADRPERTGRLRMELQKANLGRADQSIAWRWDDDAGLFVPEAAPTAFDRAHQARENQRGILAALLACARSGIPVPAATTGPRTGYHVLSAQSAFPDSLRSGKPAVRRFWREIEQLRAMGRVRDESIRRADRHYVATLVLTEEGARACGQ